MRRRLPLLLLAAALLAGLATSASAQEAVIAGTVTDAETGAPLEAVQISVIGALGTERRGGLTSPQGTFRVPVPAGSYAVVAQHIGYADQRNDGVGVRAGQTTRVDFRLVSRSYELNPIVVTGRRREEKALESPSTIVTIGKEQITEQAALSPIEHVKSLPGVDVSQTGLTQSNVVTRGFNNVFSGAMLVLTDNRYASVPSLRLNAYNMIPLTQSDVDRIEVLLGPAAALYGPNAANGVLHIITASPIDAPGTTVSVAGGERSVFQSQFRAAHRFSERAGLKLSGRYFRGHDWVHRDSAEVHAAQDDPDNPLIAKRDFDAEQYGGELRFDWRPAPDAELILNAGANVLGSSIELTGLGAGQAKDWRYTYGQARFRKGRLFLQGFLNASDAGDTYLLRTGKPIVDKSRLWAAQVQHGFAVGDRLDVIYGADLIETVPRTEGTITGRNEDDDDIRELGAYLHSRTTLTDELELVAALRVDDHSRLEDPNWSPRAALVFQPEEDQSFRVSFNRAFSTPTTNNLFLDLVAARIPLGPLPYQYDVRTLGVFESGFTFDDRCPGGVQDLCMYSPFAPDQQLPASAAVLWNGLVDGLGALNPLLQGLIPLLKTADGSPPPIQSVLRRFNQEAETFLEDAGPEAIDPISSTIHNTFEVGYKGILGDRLLLTADVYREHIQDFVGPLRVETPSVFFDPATLQAFVVQKLTAAAQGGYIDPQQIPAVTQLIVENLAKLPLGTVAPDQSPNPDLILTYRNFGDVNLWGADLAFQLLATDRLSFTGSYSHVSDECFELQEKDGSCSDPTDIALNAPRNKGSVGVRWDDKVFGLTVEGRLRLTEGFPMNSGVYLGQVDGYTVFDANVAYHLRTVPGATVSLTATNLFDDRHQEFIGAPYMGRLALLRLSYAF